MAPCNPISVFTMLCTNPEWAVMLQKVFFLFSEKSAWFSKNTAANSDDFNVCIRVVYRPYSTAIMNKLLRDLHVT